MACCLVKHVRACIRDGVAPFGLLAAMRWVTRHVRRYSLVALLFLAYRIGLVALATWYCPEIIGWYADVDQVDLLNHFRFVPSFVGETMKRNDFRFFPLAHQDLHVLSWFTPYVKVWARVSGAKQPLPVRCMPPILSEFSCGLPEAARERHPSEIAFKTAEFKKCWYQSLRRDQCCRSADLIVMPGTDWFSRSDITVDGVKRGEDQAGFWPVVLTFNPRASLSRTSFLPRASGKMVKAFQSSGSCDKGAMLNLFCG